MLLSILILVLLLIYHYTTNRKKYDLSRRIPGKLPFPFVGNIPQLMLKSKPDLFNLLVKLGNRPDPLYRVWIGSELLIIVSGSEDMKVVLNECINRSEIYESLAIFFGEGLLNLRDAAWKERRRLLNPTLSVKQVASFQSIFNGAATKIISQLEKGERNYMDIIDRATLINILQTTMGVNFGSEQNIELNKYLKIYNDLMKKCSYLMQNPLLKSNPFYQRTQFYKKLMDEAEFSNACMAGLIREGAQKSAKRRDDQESMVFINQMMRGNSQGVKFSEKDIINESTTLILAGHETSVKASVIALLLLAQHKEVQRKVYKEIMDFAPSGDLSLEQCRDLQYLDCVIKESLRLFPNLPLMTREVSHPITLSGRIIPRGTQVMVSAVSIQRSEKYWGETANQFNPDRFLPENLQANSSNYYLPFGSGPRTCIGLRYALYAMKVNLVRIIRHFEVDTPLKFDEIICTISPILHFENIENVKFTKREGS